MSVAITFRVEGIAEAAEAYGQLSDFDRPSFLDALGALGVSQTQRRIRSEKRAPDGAAWKPNQEGTSILFRSGQLDDSLYHAAAGDEVSWGSNKVYAGIHQTGGTIRPKRANMLAFSIGGRRVFAKSVTLPARPYLGISAENAKEIESFALDFVADAMGDGR